MKRVRVFVDHANFDLGWKRRVGRDFRLDWEKLPAILMDRLGQVKYLKSAELELTGVYVYASVHPNPGEADKKYAKWLTFWLDQLPAYTVKQSVRQERASTCPEHGHRFTEYVEKGVDTRIACDMLSAAIREAYEVAVILSDDADLLPSVECVQDVLDRQVIHAGFKSSGQHIRSAAWGHFLLDDAIEELKLPVPLRAVS